ncbi:MAG: TonB-dependent receptor [Verrucomicrobia bacterium]|nr:TonB-dependent receptor [Verrucomicrobiota bacterium]
MKPRPLRNPLSARRWRALGLTLALSLGLLPLAAAPVSGRVTGVVTNRATGDLLADAVVTVEGGAATTTSERAGNYSLSLPPGKYTLVVHYVGLDSARVPVTIEAERTTVADIALTSEVYVLDPVAVKGIREGNALAIQQQRQSMNVKTTVATDVFGNPAANPGELAQRLPGVAVDIIGSEVRSVYVRGMAPGFAQLTIDGDRMASSAGTSGGRDVQIEQLGTGNIQQVELIKAPTPEMDANAIGGYLNLVARRSFDSPRRQIGLTTGVLWRKRGFSGSPFQDRADGLDLLALTFSDAYGVWGGKRNLGIAFNFNFRRSATTQDEMGPGALTGPAAAWLNPLGAQPLQRVFGTGDFGYKADSRNSGLAVDYKVSDTSIVYAKLQINSNYQYQQYFRPTVGNSAATAASFTPDSTFLRTVMLPATAVTADVESSDFTKKALNWFLSGGSEHKIFQGAGLLSLRGSYSHANINYPAWIRLHSIARGIGFQLDRSRAEQWFPEFTQTAGPALTEPASYNLTSYTRQSYKAPNDLYGGRVDYKHVFRTARPLFVKLGLKYDSDERAPNQQYSQRTWVGADGAPNTSDDSMAPYAVVSYRQSDGRYGPFPFANIPGSGGKGDTLAVPSSYWGRTAADAYTDYVNSQLNDVKLRERIGAAYVQANLQLGRLRVLGGIRMEETKTRGTAWVRNTSASWGGNSVGGANLDPAVVAANEARAARSFVRRETAEGKYRNVFPGLHFVYEPFESLLLRASYNKSITRPPTANLLPSITENPDSTPPTITLGNPNLRPYTADNFELGIEKYFEPVGVVSVNVFRKNISNYFRSFVRDLGAGGLDGQGAYANYRLSQALNIGQARIQGVELRYDQQFSFLPGFWRGFGLNSNFTYLETEGDFGGVTTTRLLAGFRPRSGNAGLSYRGKGLLATLLVNWSDRFFFNEPATGFRIFNQRRTFLDLKLQYRLNPRYELFWDTFNLADEAAREEVSEDGRLYTFRTRQGISFVAGIRARF